MVADILEIPIGAEIAGHAGHPPGIGGIGHFQVAQPRRRGHIREGEALGGKAHLGAPHILHRSPVGADPEIMSDAFVRDEG